MSDEEMLPGRPYWLSRHARRSRRRSTPPKYQVNVNTMEHLAAKTLELNEIGVANLSTDRPIAFEPYTQNRDFGGFILIDKLTNATVAAGMLHFALAALENIHWQALDVTREAHAALKNQRPAVLWFTGYRARASRRSPIWSRRSLLRDEPPHLPARRRQRPPWPEQGSRLHRCRPRREHPPRRRGGEDDDRRRPDRDHGVHLAVPRRARTWCGR